MSHAFYGGGILGAEGPEIILAQVQLPDRNAFLQAVRRWVRHHGRSDTTGDAGMPGPARRVSRGEEEEAA